MVGGAREVERAVVALVRAVKARRLYLDGNAALQRAFSDAKAAIDEALAAHHTITLKVRPDALLHRDDRILEEKNPDDSIAFALFKDGIRRLDLDSGITTDELYGLVYAIAFGARYSGLGDDIVSLLWRQSLQHVRYVVVDTAIVDDVESDLSGTRAYDVTGNVDALLNAIYGDKRGAQGPMTRSISLDGSDLEAKKLARQLELPEELAPGLFPARAFRDAPVYAAPFAHQLAEENERALALRVTGVVIEALQHGDSTAEDTSLSTTLLAILDAALTEGDFELAGYVIAGVQHAAGKALADAQEKFHSWLSEAISEPRLRGVLALFRTASEEDRTRHADFFRACGTYAVPTLIALLAGFNDSTQRRWMSNMILELGVSELTPIRAMFGSDEPANVVEAIYLLAQIGTREAVEIIRNARTDPRPDARLAVLEALKEISPVEAADAASTLLYDSNPRVVISAAGTLSTLKTLDAARIMETAVKHPRFDDAPFEVKQAFLESYAITNQGRALQHLSRVIKGGDGLLTKRAQEDSSVAAVLAVAKIRAQRSVEILSATVQSHNKRVRETARNTLVRMKEGAQ